MQIRLPPEPSSEWIAPSLEESKSVVSVGDASDDSIPRSIIDEMYEGGDGEHRNLGTQWKSVHGPPNGMCNPSVGGLGRYTHNGPQGHWCYRWKDGRYFYGYVVNGIPNDKGEFYWPQKNGMHIKANYKNGHICDKNAKVTFKSGHVKAWEGSMYNNTPNGWGKLTYRDGTVVEGTFSRELDEHPDKIISVSKDGWTYKGGLNGLTPNGKGKKTWSGGSYDGNWSNGKYDGFGTHQDSRYHFKGTWSNGRKVKGSYEKGSLSYDGEFDSSENFHG